MTKETSKDIVYGKMGKERDPKRKVLGIKEIANKIICKWQTMIISRDKNLIT